MKRICAITMVRNDEFFLRRWVRYYSEELGAENVYVFMDGKDQVAPDFCKDISVTICERVNGMVARADKGRINFLSDRASELFERYDIVIGTDVDEFLVVDPLVGKTLREYLSGVKCHTTVSGLGIDVGQHLDSEVEIDDSKPLLQQRKYGFLSSRYTKANTLMRPARWGSGFHRVKGHNFHIDSNLYLFHFGSVDFKMLESRINDTDRLANGWSRHLKKRARTMLIITRAKVAKWDRTIGCIRRLQRTARPLYALNKPLTLGIKKVVEIPERFRNIV